MGTRGCRRIWEHAKTGASSWLKDRSRTGRRSQRCLFPGTFLAPSHLDGGVDNLGERCFSGQRNGLTSPLPPLLPLSARRHSPFSSPLSGHHKLSDTGRQPAFSSVSRRPAVFESAPSLRDEYPDVARQYHPTLNEGQPTPDEVSSTASFRPWWKCDKGPDHEWEASLANRTRGGNGGPCCPGLQLSVTNSRVAKFSEIAAQLHSTSVSGRCQGAKLNPISPQSLHGSPPCSRDVSKRAPSLRDEYPAVAAQYHPTRNRDEPVSVDGIGPFTSAMLWWKCEEGPDHEWQTTVASRTSGGSGCPCCAGLQLSVTNSLTAKFPQIAAELHPTKNGPGMDGSKILAGTVKKFWWKCDKGPDHEWDATVKNRTSHGSGCPCCAGLQLSVTNSLIAKFPQIAAELHPTKNGPGVDGSKILAGTHKKFWWKCNKGPDHEWQATVNHRTSHGSGCPCCAGRQLSITNSLTAKFPQIAAELHPTKNGPGVDGSKILAGTAEKFWWKCDKGPDHEWEATVSSRTSGGTGCPCCAGLQLSSTNSLTAKFPQIAAELQPTKNGPGMDGSKILAGTNKKVWWKCDKGPDHEWEATVNSRTSAGKGCPCCAGQKLSSTNSLTAKSPQIAAQLHPTKNGPGVDGSKILAGTAEKFWWKCNKGPDHEWEARVADRTSRGTGCPFCSGRRASVTNNLAT
eukprot:jgi/Mesvir1/7498/Mv25822-RA.1